MSTVLVGRHVDVGDDLTGDGYLGLLEFARRTHSEIGLVWREQLVFAPAALQIATDLQESLVDEQLTDAWPGTTLWGSRAWYRLYRCDDRSLPILSQASRLFAWRAPDRPEDLSCHLPTGECWLASASHESQARFYIDALGDSRLRELQQLTSLSLEIPTDG